MKKIFFNLFVSLAVVGIGGKSSAQYLDNVSPMAGCLDCFNFVAPSILGAENVSPAEIGLIVYDSNIHKFRGHTASGAWATLSKEEAIRNVTTTATVAVTDDVVTANATSGSFTITLPAAASVPGKILFLKKTDSGFNQVTIDGNSTETIDGSASKKLSTQNEVLKIVSDGSNWLILERRVPSEWIAYTPSGSWTSNTTYTGKWRRVGDSLEAQVYMVLSGAPNNTVLTVNIPNGLSIEQSKVTTTTTIKMFGRGVLFDVGTNAYAANVVHADTTSVLVRSVYAAGTYVWAGSGDLSATDPFTWASTDKIDLNFIVPISGWDG